MFKPNDIYTYIAKAWDDDIIQSLSEYIKIPNKSPNFDLHWQEHGFMEQAVEHISMWCKANAPKDMTLDVLRLEGRTPLLFMEIPGSSSETVLIYGHLDKQPEMDGWSEGLGPWLPVIKNGCLYGRGGADDGYSAYAAITAIRALQAEGLPHARCIIIIEASEESGSEDLPFYVETIKDRIGEPGLIICLDSGAGNYEQLWLTSSLRGNLVGELSVELLQEGIHSGYGSGVVADSFRVAKALISRIEDEDSGEITLNALHTDIPTKRLEEASQCAEVLGEAIYKELPLHKDVLPLSLDPTQLIINRTWRAALTVTGADGIPSIIDGGNVLRPKTALKLSMRLPPTVCPKKAGAEIKNALTKSPPYHAKVNFQIDSASSGWHAPMMAPWLLKAVDDASLAFYKKPSVSLGEGGTIPFMGMLGEKFPKAQFVVTGVLGPHSNAHGPNEFLHIDMAKKLTACVAFILNQHVRNCPSLD